MAKEWRDRLDAEIETLRQARDELRVQLHLAAAEAREVWVKVESKWGHLEGRMKQVGEATQESAEDIEEAAKTLLEEIRVGSAVHSHQVHGSGVHLHEGVEEGLRIAPPGDGHVTRQVGLMLTVTTADCVPVFMVDGRTRAIGLLHAGWRGAAAGILEAGLGGLIDALDSKPGDLHVHLGPAICGQCYEVGPEVFSALDVEIGERLDLRRVLASRAESMGVPGSQVTTSALSASPDSISCAAASKDRVPVAQAWLMVGPPTSSAPIRPMSQGRP